MTRRMQLRRRRFSFNAAQAADIPKKNFELNNATTHCPGLSPFLHGLLKGFEVVWYAQGLLVADCALETVCIFSLGFVSDWRIMSEAEVKAQMSWQN